MLGEGLFSLRDLLVFGLVFFLGYLSGKVQVLVFRYILPQRDPRRLVPTPCPYAYRHYCLRP